MFLFEENREIGRKKWLNRGFLPFRDAEKRRSIRYNAELGFSLMGRSYVGSSSSGLHRLPAVKQPISHPDRPCRLIHYRR